MTRYVKKKFNVGVFIVLLLCAFVPGIIYAIYKAIPTKITDEAPTKDGNKARIIGSILFCLNFIILVLLPDEDIPLIFWIYLVGGVVFVVLALLSMKTNSKALIYALLYLSIIGLLAAGYLYFYAFPSIIGAIFMIVGASRGKKYINYYSISEEERAELFQKQLENIEEE